jgi:hypothetical protein
MKHASYGWIIDKDHLHDPKSPSSDNEAGTTGPGSIAPDVEKRLQAGEGREWHMYDADQELMYSGRLLTPNDPDGGGGQDFSPLDDFGRNPGCTEIRYYDKDKRSWVVL